MSLLSMAQQVQLVGAEVHMVTGKHESDDQVDDDADEALDDAAQGVTGTSDETADGSGEIDAIGHAAGLVVNDDKPFRGIDEVDRRDEHRWELDPRSSDGETSTP